MQRTGAAVGHHRKIARVEAALCGDARHHMRHGRGGDADDAAGGFDHADRKRRRQHVLHGLLCAFQVEAHFATKKAVRRQPPEDQVGVRHGRLGAALPVAHRSGRGTSTLRSDAQAPAGFHPRNAAAAGADLLDVDQGNLDRQAFLVAADHDIARHHHLTTQHHTGLGGSAAHIEGDGIGQAQALAHRSRADHARGRAGFEHAYAFALRVGHIEQAPGGLHNEERTAELLRGKAFVDFLQVVTHARADVGVGCHRRGSLEFAIFLGKLVRCGDEHARTGALDHLAGAQFVVGVGVGMQEQDGDGADALPGQMRGNGCDLCLVQRNQRLALRVHALGHLDAPRARYQRDVLAEEQVVGVRPVDAPDFVDVAKAPRGQERRRRTGTLEHGVDADGGAMQEQARVRDRSAGLSHAMQNAFDQVRRRGEGLAEERLAGGLVEADNVGERATDVGGNAEMRRGALARRVCLLRIAHAFLSMQHAHGAPRIRNDV